MDALDAAPERERTDEGKMADSEASLVTIVGSRVSESVAVREKSHLARAAEDEVVGMRGLLCREPDGFLEESESESDSV